MMRFAASRLLGQATATATRPTAAQILLHFYHEEVIDHFDNPRNVGSFDKNDPTVGTGIVGAPACGDVMKLQIKVDEKTGEIHDARFKTFGCGSAIASSSVATEWVKGKQMEEVAYHKKYVKLVQLEGEIMQKETEVQKLMEESVRLTALLDKVKAQLLAMNEQCKASTIRRKIMQKETEVQKLMEESVRLTALLDKVKAQLLAMNEQCKVMALSASFDC